MHSYGSAPGELAACVTHVGLVQRPGLSAIRATSEPRVLEAVTEHCTGHALAVGGSVRVAGAWWCRPDEGSLLFLGTPDALVRTVDLLGPHIRRRPTLFVDSDPARLAVVGVIGRHTVDLLRELGVYGALRDPREAPPCAQVKLGPAETVWLLESDSSALCCVERSELAAVEALIAQAGRPLGLARVGQDALAHFLLLERRRTLAALRTTA